MQTSDAEAPQILDTSRLGRSLRLLRLDAGYERAEDLSEALSLMLGYSVSKQVIYNIESGKQEPKLGLFLAIMRAIYPYKNLEINDIVLDCLPHSWSQPLETESEEDELTEVLRSANLSESQIAGVTQWRDDLEYFVERVNQRVAQLQNLLDAIATSQRRKEESAGKKLELGDKNDWGNNITLSAEPTRRRKSRRRGRRSHHKI